MTAPVAVRGKRIRLRDARDAIFEPDAFLAGECFARQMTVQARLGVLRRDDGLIKVY